MIDGIPKGHGWWPCFEGKSHVKICVLWIFMGVLDGFPILGWLIFMDVSICSIDCKVVRWFWMNVSMDFQGCCTVCFIESTRPGKHSQFANWKPWPSRNSRFKHWKWWFTYEKWWCFIVCCVFTRPGISGTFPCNQHGCWSDDLRAVLSHGTSSHRWISHDKPWPMTDPWCWYIC